MSIMLGNLSIAEIEKRSGVKFPEDLIAYMQPRKQEEEARNVKVGCWHCFDIPFTLVCGDMDTATEIHRHLAPLGSSFKEPLRIALS